MEQQKKHEGIATGELIELILKYGLPLISSIFHKHKDNPLLVDAVPKVPSPEVKAQGDPVPVDPTHPPKP